MKFLYFILADLLLLCLQRLLVGQLALEDLTRFLELFDPFLEFTDLVLVALLLPSDLTLVLLDLLEILFLLVDDLLLLHLQLLIFLLNSFFKLRNLSINLLTLGCQVFDLKL